MTKKIEDGGPRTIIDLVNGGTAIISAVDAPSVEGLKWRRAKNGYIYRAGAKAKGSSCLLHRIVVKAPKGKEVHHINGVKEDCRRENLLLVSPSEHQFYHRDSTIESNKRRRVYSYAGTCKSCGREYVKDPDHRGRQTCCSKLCAIHWAVKQRSKPKSGMLLARKSGGEA